MGLLAGRKTGILGRDAGSDQRNAQRIGQAFIADRAENHMRVLASPVSDGVHHFVDLAHFERRSGGDRYQ